MSHTVSAVSLRGLLACGAAFAIAGPVLAQPPQAQSPTAQSSTPAAQTPPAQSSSPATTVEGLTVSGARQQVETSIDRRSYSVADDLQGRTGTIADVLRNIPSVQVDVNGNVTLRGDGNITVLVDGRPSAQFSRENLAQALQTLPADQVERIEVLTNPSAEFRADGSAGIINLVMKRARGAGRTGSLRVNAASTGSYDATVSHGFNADKLSVIDSLTFRHGRLRANGLYERELAAGGGSRDVLVGRADPDGVQGRAAVDYDLNRTTRLSASIAAAWQAGAQVFIDDFTQVNAGGATVLAFQRESTMDLTGRNGQVDATLRNRWADNHTFTLNIAGSDNTVLNDRADFTTRTAPAAPLLAERTVRNNYNGRAALTADYQKPLDGGVQLKAGYLIEYVDSLIEHRGGAGAAADIIPLDPARTDDFSDIATYNNAYVTLQKTFGQLTALGGLRVETVHLDLDQVTLGTHHEQDYERVYPTLHLTHALGEGRSLTASYSKRVQRPAPIDLDPYRYTVNANVAVQGNPALTPQDTDSFELVFERRKGPAFTLVTAYHRQTDNAFSNTLTDLGNGVLLQSRANLGRQSSTGVEWTMGDRLSPKLTYNLSINAFETRISDPGAVAVTADSSAFTSFGRANLTWQATPKDLFQFNVFANGKQILPQGYVEPSFSGNLGYRRTLTEKLSLMVVVRDPFDSLKNVLVIETPAGRETRIQRSNNRAVSVAFIWNFAGRPRGEAGFDFTPGGTAGASAPVP